MMSVDMDEWYQCRWATDHKVPIGLIPLPCSKVIISPINLQVKSSLTEVILEHFDRYDISATFSLPVRLQAITPGW